MKIGVLYPRSTAHPGMMQDFMDGIKTALHKAQLSTSIQLLAESIGFGGNEKEVYEKAEKLLVLEGADVLVGYVDLRVLDILKPLLYASGKLLIVVNAGANFPQNWVPQPNIVYLTLHHGFLCWLSGKLAARKGLNAVMATTFYDCGYLHTAAIVKGFVQAGGNITFNYINKDRYDSAFDIKQLTDYVAADKEASVLLCVFDSLPASLFYSRLNAYNDADNLHLFVSPMMLEEKALEQIDAGFRFSVEGYRPWHASIENGANQEFMAVYNQQTKRAATTFSLLGWEAGLIVQEIFFKCNDQYEDGATIVGELRNIKIDSPRGEMKLDEETNHFISPAYKISIKENSGKAIIEVMTDLEGEWAAFTTETYEGVSSGWTNTYLCY